MTKDEIEQLRESFSIKIMLEHEEDCHKMDALRKAASAWLKLKESDYKVVDGECTEEQKYLARRFLGFSPSEHAEYIEYRWCKFYKTMVKAAPDKANELWGSE